MRDFRKNTDGACRARHVGEPGGGRGCRGAALVDLRRRGGGAERAEGGPRSPGHRLAGHAGGRRRRHPGDDRAAGAGHVGQPADGGPDARLRHPRLGQGRRARQPEPDRRRGRLGRRGAGGAAEVLQVRRPVDRGSGQRPLDQLGLGQQAAARRARHCPADDLGRTRRGDGNGQGGRQDRRRPWRPGLAGRDHLRRGRDVDRRTGVLPEGLHRPRPGGARSPTP